MIICTDGNSVTVGLHYFFCLHFILYPCLIYACSVNCFRFDAIEQIEDALTGLKVIAFTENCIRLSLRTYIPKLEGLLHQHTIEDISEASEVNHELLIEVREGTMELKSVEVSEYEIFHDFFMNLFLH